MRKIWTYILVVIVSVLIGMGLMVGVMYFFPNVEEVVKTVTEQKVDVSISDTGIAESVQKVKDSVVVIEVYSGGMLVSTGTGFVYDSEDDKAYIMTNHHVIDGAKEIVITYSDDSETTASIVGSDEYADIAVLSVSKDTILSVAELGNNESVRVGDTVFTIGSPMGIEYRGTVTRGILSGKDRLVEVSVRGYDADWIMNVMQTDAAINPGNSGGPLCNVNGEVIGINSLKIVEDTIEGIGFAIPIEDALLYARDIRESGSIKRPYIGVSMLNASSTMQLAYSGIRLDKSVTDGVVIVEVEKDSAAYKAGIKVGDVIVKVHGDSVKDIAEFRYRLYNYAPEETIDMEINRDGDILTVSVTLGSN